MPAGARSPCEGGNPEAYRAYLSGRYLNNRPDSARLRAAVRDFQHAIELDPGCARAYAGLAFAYRGEVMTGDRRPRDLFPSAKAAVAQALAIDPSLAEAYATRGFIEFWYDWNWPAAEASLQHAIRLNPGLPEAHLAYAHLLTNLGRSAQAAEEARRALADDPLSPLVNTLAAGFLDDAGHHAEARVQLGHALELDPDFWVALLTRGGMALGSNDLAHALPDLRRARVLSHDNSQALVVLAQGEVQAGNRDAAERILEQLQARATAGYVPATSLAAIQLALGHRDAAMDLLEQAFAERDVRLSFLAVDYRFDALRGSARFRALLERMRLQDARARKTVADASSICSGVLRRLHQQVLGEQPVQLADAARQVQGREQQQNPADEQQRQLPAVQRRAHHVVAELQHLPAVDADAAVGDAEPHQQRRRDERQRERSSVTARVK